MQFKVLTLIFKAPHCLEVSYPRYHISPYASSRQLKSAAVLAVQNPPVNCGEPENISLSKEEVPKDHSFSISDKSTIWSL